MVKEELLVEESLAVQAVPTKELFIRMLTRDIGLMEAITDLADNCVDGARFLAGDGPYDNLEVHIDVKGDRFRIDDNCGGILVETARDYAFRFGRPEEATPTPHSIGRFGVGMKRAIFKMGKRFTVDSRTSKSRFLIEQDITKWAKMGDKWEFKFSKPPEENVKVPAKEVGTTIAITNLHTDVANQFKSPTFLAKLGRWLSSRLQVALGRGLKVFLNTEKLSFSGPRFLADSQLLPARQEFWIPRATRGRDSKRTSVSVVLYCGLIGTQEEVRQSGWHVFCNGRLVLEGDKTDVTGWGESGIPKHHGQYNQFMGLAFFESYDPDKLPWNTAKTGIDKDSAVYGKAKQRMLAVMLPVKNFLDSLKREKDRRKDTDGPLSLLVKRSKRVEHQHVKTRKIFKTPPSKEPKAPTEQTISYRVPYKKAIAVKDKLEVTSWRLVGLETFDYFCDAEMDE